MPEPTSGHAGNAVGADGARGHLLDRLARAVVRVAGRRADAASAPWLIGPVGAPEGIGPDYFDRWAVAHRLRAERGRPGAGLLPSFAALAGREFDPSAVDPAVAEFYERAAGFDVDLWSQWSPWARPLGSLAAAAFCRRLGQFNLPLSPLDPSWGVTSEVVRVTDPATGELRVSGWVRTLVKTGRVVLAGCYSVADLPGAPGPCVRAVYPLPGGSVVVALRPHARPDGSLLLTAEGRRFGDPGLYLTALRPDGAVRAWYVRGFRKRIGVYRAGAGVLRADHTMSLWGCRCLHLHYRLRRRPTGPAQPPARGA